MALKEKSEDKILNFLNDFEDTKSNLAICFEEIKSSETNFNEIIKGNFLHNLVITIRGIKNLKICFDETIDNKIKYLKFDEELLNINTKEVTELEYISNNTFDIQTILESKGLNSGNLKL